MVSFAKGILVNKSKKKTFSSWNLIERPTLGKMAIIKDNAWVPNSLKGTTG